TTPWPLNAGMLKHNPVRHGGSSPAQTRRPPVHRSSRGAPMRGVIPVVAVLLLLLAGCDNSNDAEKTHQATHAGTPQTSTAPAKVGTLESQTPSLTQVAEGCSGDDCPQVSIQWPEYVGQPALNKAIHQQLVAQLASSRPGQPA